MKKLNTKYIIILSAIATVGFSSCLKSEFDARERTEGDANFKHYVSVGNSLTQGYQDGGLHNEENQQDYSYPALIAQQMKIVNSDMAPFLQPTTIGEGSGHRKLILDTEGELGVTSVDADNSWPTWGDEAQGTKYSNLGIAGIQLRQCYARTNNEYLMNHAILGGLSLLGGDPLNPYGAYLDFGAEPGFTGPASGTKTYVDLVSESNATFFTCWMGNNDVLGWSLAGGDEGVVNVPIIGNIEMTPLTPVDEFTTKYEALLLAFHNQGAKGVCATLPDVSAIPMFTTVNAAYREAPEIWITDGGTGNVRKQTAEDMVLLYALTDLDAGHGLSASDPLADSVVLDKFEVAEVQTRIGELNNVIYSLANKYGYGVADMFEYLNSFESGFSENGVDLSAKFIEGGVFSLDGVHPNPKGYAIIANKFIEAINFKYKSNVPRVDVNQYKAILFPND